MQEHLLFHLREWILIKEFLMLNHLGYNLDDWSKVGLSVRTSHLVSLLCWLAQWGFLPEDEVACLLNE
jgi:hypothetical protein